MALLILLNNTLCLMNMLVLVCLIVKETSMWLLYEGILLYDGDRQVMLKNTAFLNLKQYCLHCYVALSNIF